MEGTLRSQGLITDSRGAVLTMNPQGPSFIVGSVGKEARVSGGSRAGQGGAREGGSPSTEGRKLH